MSLSRILNEEKSPSPNQPPSQSQAFAHAMAIDPALMDMPMHAQPSPGQPQGGPLQHNMPPNGVSGHDVPPNQFYYPPPQGFPQQPPGFPQPDWDPQWDPYASGVWGPDDGNGPPRHPSDQPYGRDGMYYQQPPPNEAPVEIKKRKRTDASAEKRSQPGRSAKGRARASLARQSPSPPGFSNGIEPHHVPDDTDRNRFFHERSRLASDDLADCEEIWTEELGKYVLESRIRIKQVEAWFQDKSEERIRDIARHNAHSYHGRLVNISAVERTRHMDHDILNPLERSIDNSGYDHLPYGHDDDSAIYDQESWRNNYEDSVDEVARELDDTAPESASKKGKGKKSAAPPRRKRRRAQSEDQADEEEDYEAEAIPTTGTRSRRKSTKRTKVNHEEDLDAAEELERFAEDSLRADDPVPSSSPKQSKAQKAAPSLPASDLPADASAPIGDVAPSLTDVEPAEGIDDVASPAPVEVKPKRKRAPRKKKIADAAAAPGASADPSFQSTGGGDDSPRPPSPPAQTTPGSPLMTGFYNLDDPIPDMKKPKKVDQLVLARRLITLEEAQRKVWTTIAKRDVTRVYKLHSQGFTNKIAHHKKLSSMAAQQAKRVSARTSKATKDIQAKARRLTREMLVFWKKNEKEEGASRKKAEKEALDKVKAEEEKREAQRQARKLEFLITQTELYSHFVGNKLKTSELEDEPGRGSEAGPSAKAPLIDIESSEVVEGELAALDFDEDDQTNLTLHAARKAQQQVMQALQRAQAFDAAAASDRLKNEALAAKAQLVAAAAAATSPSSEEAPQSTNGPLVDFDSDELNFQNPTSMTDETQVAQPKMLTVQLKDYQLKGLNWLATLYEQGINGILADEMGLGKTVQSISLLAYLIETHDIWGPFLVIAPASTLFNWQQELARFVPKVKALPYWGNPKDRALLRKFWSKKEISYNEDAPFNVLITSYQMVVQDAQYFQKVNWQYMILDEAQAIKSSASARWKTLLGFNCRNRLLLTGTPIQNSMQELWALLHFIMPTLFDSHDEFSEWFSKDIENHAENQGQSNLNEHQLRRLHMILKPFMLRRIKKNVQNELGDKIEIDLFCDLSPRQRALYRGLRQNVSVSQLLARASNLGDEASTRSLMNLVMQFRKVCNHPDLFERADVASPVAFCHFASTGNMSREKDILHFPYSTTSLVTLSLPKLFYEDGALPFVPAETLSLGEDTRWLGRMMNIWDNDWITHSLQQHGSAFSFLPLLDLSPAEAHDVYASHPIRRLLLAKATDDQLTEHYPFLFDSDFAASSIRPFGKVCTSPVSHIILPTSSELPLLTEISANTWQTSCLSRPDISRCHSQKAVAPPVHIDISDRSFVERHTRLLHGDPLDSLALYGLPPSLEDSGEAYAALMERLPCVPPRGLLNISPVEQLPKSTTIVPEGKNLIFDSAKLARLDALLDELKPAGHRVLIYFQMTRMIDLMEEYMTYRKHKYLRLDGSSKLEDRRDMVIDWQTRPDIFVFLLSTRAGGLGINLTAADTVIFYDHDWNPSNDSQAMDRAHRLGQTRQVTVYRLITKGTIDERIVQLARVKKDVQDIVVGQKQIQDGAKTNDIASLLLNDDELALVNSPGSANVTPPEPTSTAVPTNMWPEEDGDDFFGQTATANSMQAALDADVNDDLPPAATPGAAPAGAKKKTGKKSHKRKPGPATGDTLPDDL